MNLQLCDPDRLDAFVRADLNEQQESELISHLNHCARCGADLEQRVAAADQWREAGELLNQCSSNSPKPFDSVNDMSCETARDSVPNGRQLQQVIGMLAATDDPQMLGRIGAYEVSGVIGCGGMGVVFKAHDRSLDRVVAIKVMAPHLAGSGAARKRFARESKAAAAVLHSNVIAIHSVDDNQDLPFLVMPYVAGASLQKRIEADGPLCLSDTLRIAQQIASGLAAAHAQGLVHRDIKPANILLQRGVERVTITDFGLARAVDDATMTRSGVIAGTPQYMSPEQACGAGVDHRSDLFSLGSVLYAMCTGHSPFRAETTFGILRRITDNDPRPIREINPDVPEWFCAIVDKLHAKEASERFQSAEEVAELLEDCLAHVQQPTTTPLPEPIAKLAGAFTAHRSLRTAKNRGGIRFPPIGKLIGVTFAFFLMFGGVLIVLELNKGTLTINSEVDDVQVRILRGDETVDELTVTKSGESIRVSAGEYVVAIIGNTDGLSVRNGKVTLRRAGTAAVTIALSDSDDRPLLHDQPSETDSQHADKEDQYTVVVDLYCGDDVLPQMNSQGKNKDRHVKMLRALNALSGVTTNFREKGKGNEISSAVVRYPAKSKARESTLPLLESIRAILKTARVPRIQSVQHSPIKELFGEQSAGEELSGEGLAATSIKQRMQGTWIVESLIEGNENGLASASGQVIVQIKGNIMRQTIGTEDLSGPILLADCADTDTPHAEPEGTLLVDMVYLPNGDSETHQGIIQCDGETLSICAAVKPATSSNGFRPKFFVAGSKVALWKCRRASQDEEEVRQALTIVKVREESKSSGIIRGSVIGLPNDDRNIKYVIRLIETQEADDVKHRRSSGLSPRKPGLVVGDGESFRFTGVPVGKYSIEAVALIQSRRQIIGKPVRISLEISPKQTFDLGITFNSEEDTAGWIKSVSQIDEE